MELWRTSSSWSRSTRFLWSAAISGRTRKWNSVTSTTTSKSSLERVWKRIYFFWYYRTRTTAASRLRFLERRWLCKLCPLQRSRFWTACLWRKLYRQKSQRATSTRCLSSWTMSIPIFKRSWCRHFWSSSTAPTLTNHWEPSLPWSSSLGWSFWLSPRISTMSCNLCINSTRSRRIWTQIKIFFI